tara:strand:- start:2147 stop:3067 length:921 start_codon:yes stop_codon:yes gene_type:complete
MAKQVRGLRANKPNDSFGVTNNPNLYRGKYREEVYKDEEDGQEETEQKTQDPTTEEVATQEKESESFVSPEKKEATPPEHDYKKRYDDLKRHYDQKIQEFKSKEQELESVMQQATNSNMPLPKTAEELEKFRQEYPDVYDVIETIASTKASERSQGLQEELQTIKAREKESLVKSAFRELLNLHPDFEKIKSDDKFLQWLEEQPDTISDGILKNNTDARLASRVIDLYKADAGISSAKNQQNNKKSAMSAAVSVKSPKAKEINTNPNANKKIWKSSEIAKLKSWEFEKLEKEIDLAREEGRIDVNN